MSPLLLLCFFMSILSSHVEAMAHFGWRVPMEEEFNELQEGNTWDLTTIPPGKDVMGCR